MSDLAGSIVVGFIVILLFGLGWWLFISTEGVYLGRRTVIWLYDLYAQRYDDVKNFYDEYERVFLSRPIMGALAPFKSPLVLDVATGTGRLPLVLLEDPNFQGRVIGIDLSRRMLSLAAYKLRAYGERASLIWFPAESLPFADDTFDVVTCLESLEFTSDPKQIVRELVRVLRPGGILLITNRISTRLMPGKTWSSDEVRAILESLGVEQVSIETWQVDYDQVWGLKRGQSPHTGARPLDEVLRCPRCRDSLMVRKEQTWVCQLCEGHAPIGSDGVIELFSLHQ